MLVASQTDMARGYAALRREWLITLRREGSKVLSTNPPFAAGEHWQVTVKVIDQRGNELLVVKSLKEAT